MTAASYTTNLTNIYTSDSETTTLWSAIGTGGAGLNIPETDYYIQGTACATKNAFASSTKGLIRVNTDAGGSGTDGAYIAWMTHTAPNSLAAKASGGMQFLIGSASGAYKQHYVGGSDTMKFQGWLLVAVKEQSGYEDATTGSPSATVESAFGGLWNLPSGGPTKGAPNAIDGIRVGRVDTVIEFGTGADPDATFAGALAVHDSDTNRYGTLTQRIAGGVIENSGLVQFGTATNAVNFTDSDQSIVLRAHDHVTANFHTWEANNASSIVNFTRVNVTALGGNSIGRWITNNNATLNWIGGTFTDYGTLSFDTNSTIEYTFLRCKQITHGGATMNNTAVLLSTVAADEGAVLYDINVDPDGEMDNMTFSKGTNAHHAIRFGTNVPATMTLRGCDFSGFGSSDDANDSVFRFDDTSGSITLNLVNCTHDGSGFTVDDAAGVTVTVVIDPATTKFTVKDINGTAIQNARVLAETADNGGGAGFPFEAAVSTLTQSAGTATLTASAVHGLATNDYVVIRGAQPDGYNKVAQITVTSTTVFTYSVDSGLSSPATGTPVFSYAPIGGLLTDASGIVSSSKTWPASQGLKGWARKKNTSSPFYKDSDINVADASGGTNQTLTLQPDE